MSDEKPPVKDNVAPIAVASSAAHDKAGLGRGTQATPVSIEGPSEATEPIVALKTSGKGSFRRIDNLLSAASVVALVATLFVVGSQALELATAGRDYTIVLNLLLVGAGAFGLGTFAGFIFGAAGEEKQSFAGMATVLNGILGGFAISDLTKHDSLIKSVLHSLARSCGLHEIGLIGCIVAFYGPMGFMFMYMNKQYLLNPALSKKQQMAEQIHQLTALTRGVRVSLTEIGSRPTTDPKIVDGLKTSIKNFETAAQNDPEIIELLSAETLNAYAKAYYVTGELDKAESMLRRARNLSPDDYETLFYLSHILITARRPIEAIPYLTFLAATPNAPILTWKLLGYACLFDPNRLDDAERASRKFLCFSPNDAAVQLNLACVFGQKGPSDKANVTNALAILRTAIVLDPNLRKIIKETLTQEGQDFAAWKDNEEFKNLFA